MLLIELHLLKFQQVIQIPHIKKTNHIDAQAASRRVGHKEHKEISTHQMHFYR
jgi:hypothetical protein